jgi:PhnB protein
MTQKDTIIPTTIAPWLSIENCNKAITFYRHAFDATEAYRLEMDGGLVVKLSVGGAEFWLSGNSSDNEDFVFQPLGGGSIRMILTVHDPDALFAKALTAGALEVFPIGEEHGWRLGRLIDPFGLHWEIGHPL